jgi:hypothetical protein
MKALSTLILSSASVFLMIGPALAGPAVTHVPEPLSLSLLAGGVVAIAVAKRLRGR